MKPSKLLALCALCALWAAGGAEVARAQSREKAFDPSMSLEETMAWLGGQLNQTRTEVFGNGQHRRQLRTQFISAEGCALSYWSTSATELADPTLTSQTRELWTVDLSGLDPRMVRAMTAGRVHFTTAGEKQDVIRTSVFHNQKSGMAHHNRQRGSIMVGDKKAAEVAEGLRHAVGLCRQRQGK